MGLGAILEWLWKALWDWPPGWTSCLVALPAAGIVMWASLRPPLFPPFIALAVVFLVVTFTATVSRAVIAWRRGNP